MSTAPLRHHRRVRSSKPMVQLARCCLAYLSQRVGTTNANLSLTPENRLNSSGFFELHFTSHLGEKSKFTLRSTFLEQNNIMLQVLSQQFWKSIHVHLRSPPFSLSSCFPRSRLGQLQEWNHTNGNRKLNWWCTCATALSVWQGHPCLTRGLTLVARQRSLKIECNSVTRTSPKPCSCIINFGELSGNFKARFKLNVL